MNIEDDGSYTEKAQEMKEVLEVIEQIKTANTELKQKYIRLAAQQKELESKFDEQQQEIKRMNEENGRMKVQLSLLVQNQKDTHNSAASARGSADVVVRRSPRLLRKRRKEMEESEKNAPSPKKRKMNKSENVSKNRKKK